MRTLIALLAAALIAAVVTAAALADGPPTTPKTPKAHAGQKFFAGEVIAVGSGSLTVKVDKTGKKDTDLNGQTLTVSVDSSTQITLGKDKTQAQLSDLEVGYRAGVTVKA
jgi:energy-converting hydrogenase Eha subunit A